MSPKLKHVLLGVVAFALLVAPVFFLPSIARNPGELRSVKFGYPIPFIEQNLVCKTSFEFYPNYLRFAPKDVKNCPIRNFSLVGFAGSFLAIFLALEALVYVLEFLDFQARRLLFGRE